jgi:hypothetical protein
MKRIPAPSEKPNWWTTVSSIATLLSALASLAAVWVAVSALHSSQVEAHLDSQAWMSPKEGATLTVLSTNAAQIRQDFVNTGRTPAENGRVSRYLVFLPPTITKEELAKTLEDNDAKNGFSDIGPVSPSSPLQVDANGPVSDFQDGKRVLYFRIRIEYDDIFGKPHKTYDCSLVSYSALSTTYGM